MLRTKFAIVLFAAAALNIIGLSAASADVIYDYDFDITATNSHGHATIEVQSGHIVVTLTNLAVDPTDVPQNITGFWFTTSDAVTGATLASSSGLERRVDKNGVYTDGSIVPTDWDFTAIGSTITLSALGSGSPVYTILGAPNATTDKYDNANGGIAGNKAHNPFIAITATYDIDVPGLSSDATLSDVQMRFGTNAGSDIFNPTQFTTIPEPATMALFGLGAFLITKGRRTR